ncbi:hypothetical protein [Candidatus Nanohalovita haloferacivicina]|uniref:hypothetical protein n=1 Tax=Candidatus Nanohalovita haloferacivicina TaxID=2978046 RepID=UPI00325FAD83|nr:hypothetical protein HBNXNv_1075 [Candidatus Nanohalobia archaeon BNXNv]
MHAAIKVVGALVLSVILISALFGAANTIVKDSGNKGAEAGNNRSDLLGCIGRNAHQDNPEEFCKNTAYQSDRGEPANA